MPDFAHQIVDRKNLAWIRREVGKQIEHLGLHRERPAGPAQRESFGVELEFVEAVTHASSPQHCGAQLQY